jgi:trans-aconitate 3-methyltransferase
MASVEKEKTFRSFTDKQGANYAQNRGDYHKDVYNSVINHHAATGGQFDTVMDVGCGPGTAVRALAQFFPHAIGLDPSEGMISAARSVGGTTKTSEPIRFEVSAAEELGTHLAEPIPDGSVDLLTAATAAHWFDMQPFWQRAARVLKPGGTVAIWTAANFRASETTPAAEEIQAVIDRFNEIIDPYVVEGNRLVSDLYRDLKLPWTVAEPVPEFDQAEFMRKEWGTGPGSGSSEKFRAASGPADLDLLEKVMSTMSPVIRWREAHPEETDTESDIVKVLRRELEAVFRAAGVEPGKDVIQGGVTGVLLMVKKKA